MRTPASLVFLLLIALAGITAGITLVVIALKNSPGLVRSDYYQDGLRLDEHRAYEAAFDSLEVSLALREEDGALILQAAGEGLARAGVRERLASLEVTLELRRPDDPAADRDVALTFASDAPPLWVADVAPLRRGLWNVRAVYAETGPQDTKAVHMMRSFTYMAPGRRDAVP